MNYPKIPGYDFLKHQKNKALHILNLSSNTFNANHVITQTFTDK